MLEVFEVRALSQDAVSLSFCLARAEAMLQA